MRLLWVGLQDFRNHRATLLERVAGGVTAVVGANGEGKTNLLEGISFLFFLASPRSSANQPLVREGAEAAYVRGEVETLGGRALIEVEIPSRGANRVQVNGSMVRRKRDLRRQVRAVYFGPEDLDVVRGDPAERRRFLDEAVVALWPLKGSVLAAYERVLRQRNRLLRDWEGRGVPRGLDTWDAELVEAGCAVTRLRAGAVERLADPAEEEFEHLAGHGLSCRHRASVVGEPLEEAFRARLHDRRADELIRRTSLVGPHRDDLDLVVRDLGARSFASHGEMWGAALALRLGLAAAIEEEVGEQPVVLLDDPFSALDPLRQARVSERLGSRGQVLVSVADEAHIPAAAGRVWDVSDGRVKVRGS